MIKKTKKLKGEAQAKARISKDGPRSTQEIHEAPQIHEATHRHQKKPPKGILGSTFWNQGRPKEAEVKKNSLQ